MIYRIGKKDRTLTGTIHLTPSKSISNRALIIRSLCREQFPIVNLATADDTLLLQKLLSSTSETIDAEDAGTAFRFLASWLARKPGEWLLTGTSRMKERPIGIVVDALRKLGAEIIFTEKENYPPLKITGKKLTGGNIEIDGSISSQFISSLLMIAPTLEAGLTLQLRGEASSVPYIEMTLKLMASFGIHYQWKGNEISINQQEYEPAEIRIENDWSAASYWYEMAVLSDKVDLTLEGLKIDSLQGDSVIAEIMKPFGVETEFISQGIRLTKNDSDFFATQPPYSVHPAPYSSPSFSHNFRSHPDLVQTLAVACAALGIEARFNGVQNLRIKESDRLKALQAELKKIGVKTEISDSDLQISNSKNLHPSPFPFQTYNDHRMAMSLAALALRFGEVEIENPEVVKKSYPEFWDDLKSAGFEIKEI